MIRKRKMNLSDPRLLHVKEYYARMKMGVFIFSLPLLRENVS